MKNGVAYTRRILKHFFVLRIYFKYTNKSIAVSGVTCGHPLKSCPRSNSTESRAQNAKSRRRVSMASASLPLYCIANFKVTSMFTPRMKYLKFSNGLF